MAAKQEYLDADDDEALARERDVHMLEAIGGLERSERESDAFADMLDGLESGRFRTLTEAQRRWVEESCDREGVDKTPPRHRKPVPRGREVPLAPSLQHLPKKPPGRR